MPWTGVDLFFASLASVVSKAYFEQLTLIGTKVLFSGCRSSLLGSADLSVDSERVVLGCCWFSLLDLVQPNRHFWYVDPEHT